MREYPPPTVPDQPPGHEGGRFGGSFGFAVCPGLHCLSPAPGGSAKAGAAMLKLMQAAISSARALRFIGAPPSAGRASI